MIPALVVFVLGAATTTSKMLPRDEEKDRDQNEVVEDGVIMKEAESQQRQRMQVQPEGQSSSSSTDTLPPPLPPVVVSSHDSRSDDPAHHTFSLLSLVYQLLQNAFVIFCMLVHAAQAFIITSFAALLPLYMERRFKVSKSTAAFIMAATVPFLVAGTIVGGIWSRRRQLGLQQQLHVTWVASLVSTCFMLIFLIEAIVPFIAVLLTAMFIISLKAGPQTSLLSNACQLIVVHRIQCQGQQQYLKGEAATVSGDGSRSALHAVVPAVQGHQGDGGDCSSSSSQQVPIIPVAAAAAQEVVNVAVTHRAKDETDRLIAAVSGLVSIAVRLLGTIPGPIVLSVLVDSTGWPIHYPFLVVGFAACGVMTGSAMIAARLCPNHADRDVTRFHAACTAGELKYIFDEP
jgi:MFS family permease